VGISASALLLPCDYIPKHKNCSVENYALQCEDDNLIPLLVREEATKRKCQEEGAKRGGVERLKSGHSLFLRKIDETARFLRRADRNSFC